MNVYVELVHDQFRHRSSIGRSNNTALIRVTAGHLLAEAERRAAELNGIDDIEATRERAEAQRLRETLSLIFDDYPNPTK